MKGKLVAIIFSCILIFSLTACSDSEPVRINISNDKDISINQFGEFVYIGNNLVYDSATGVVYIANYTYDGNCVYVPYYAPNGFPYRYNSETNTFEEINN